MRHWMMLFLISIMIFLLNTLVGNSHFLRHHLIGSALAHAVSLNLSWASEFILMPGGLLMIFWFFFSMSSLLCTCGVCCGCYANFSITISCTWESVICFWWISVTKWFKWGLFIWWIAISASEKWILWYKRDDDSALRVWLILIALHSFAILAIRFVHFMSLTSRNIMADLRLLLKVLVVCQFRQRKQTWAWDRVWHGWWWSSWNGAMPWSSCGFSYIWYWCTSTTGYYIFMLLFFNPITLSVLSWRGWPIMVTRQLVSKNYLVGQETTI